MERQAVSRARELLGIVEPRGWRWRAPHSLPTKDTTRHSSRQYRLGQVASTCPIQARGERFQQCQALGPGLDFLLLVPMSQGNHKRFGWEKPPG